MPSNADYSKPDHRKTHPPTVLNSKLVYHFLKTGKLTGIAGSTQPADHFESKVVAIGKIQPKRYFGYI